jgi:hypothetical protein
MADVLIPVGIFVGCAVLAGAILAARDARRHRLRQEQRPLEDRIADIRASAADMAHQLQGVLDRRGTQQPEAVDWISHVLAYYRRLETLAAAPEASAEEIQRLAEDASTYVRERRLKGIFIGQEAEQLAALVRRRNAA